MTKSFFFKTLAGFAAGLLVLACTPTVIPELSLSDLAANFEATGALEKTVSVTSNVDWTVSCPDAWVTVSPASGTGNGTFKISVQENKAFDARTSTVTVKAGDKSSTVKVSQLGLTPSILVAPATLEIEAAGGTVSVDVTSNSPWTVSVPSDGSWATPDATSGEGNKKVTFTVAPNTAFEARSVEITFTAQDKKATVKITQAAPAPTLEVNPTAISIEADGGAQEITVTSNAPWTVTVAEDWITVEPASGEGDGKVLVTVAGSDVRSARSAVVTVKETVGNSEKTVTVNQDAVPIGHKADSLALVAIFNATGGAGNWHADRVWDLTKPIDQWYNVKVNDAGRVTQVNLANGTVTAPWTLPAAVGDLTEMTNFRIIGCQLTGAIPEEVYNMTKLVSFYLTKNTPTWTLSSKIARMTDLKDLYIDQNENLTGTLPKELGQLKKLVNINVSQTHVSGSIPAEMSGCTALANLMAYKTQISGIPDNFDLWPALKLIQLYSNPNLTGPLPASVGNCTKLTSVWFYDCNFTGNVPESWANLPSTCTQLRIQDNKLKGVVPAAVQKHANFEKWNAAKYILPQQEGYGLTLHAGSGGQNLDNPVDEDPWN
jgi:hypothetical protein